VRVGLDPEWGTGPRTPEEERATLALLMRSCADPDWTRATKQFLACHPRARAEGHKELLADIFPEARPVATIRRRRAGAPRSRRAARPVALEVAA
jgi:hypothetical protein